MNLIDVEAKNPALIDDYIRDFAARGSVFMPPEHLELPSDLEFGPISECFATCFLAALRSDGKYLYCEGLGIVDGEAYVHAWLTDSERKTAYDLTWRAITKSGQEVCAPAFYKGHVLDTEACKRFIISTKMAGVVPSRDARPRLYKAILKASNIHEPSL